jgi:hypothetical protein
VLGTEPRSEALRRGVREAEAACTRNARQRAEAMVGRLLVLAGVSSAAAAEARAGARKFDLSAVLGVG